MKDQLNLTAFIEIFTGKNGKMVALQISSKMLKESVCMDWVDKQ